MALKTVSKLQDTDEEEYVFALLREYDVILSNQVKIVLQKLKFTSIQSISQLELASIAELEKDFREHFATPDRLSGMSQEQKVALFGEDYADNPQSFKSFPGEKCSLGYAISTAKKLCSAYALNYVYEKCESVGQVRRKRQLKAKSTTRSSDTDGANTERDADTALTDGSSEGEIKRKGRTLDQYLRNWLIVTKLKLDFDPTDWEIRDRGCSIVCKRCKNRPFKVTVDSRGGWKPSSFMGHLSSAHVSHDNHDNGTAQSRTPLTTTTNNAANNSASVSNSTSASTSPPLSEEEVQNIRSVVDESEPPEKRQRQLEPQDF